MHWFEQVQTSEFVSSWSQAFAGVKALFPENPQQASSDRAYPEKRALWVEVREPMLGVRLVSLELPTDVNPPRMYVRVWSYDPDGNAIHEALETMPWHRHAIKNVPRYADKPQPSWQAQLDKAGVQVKGLRHYVDISELGDAGPSEALARMKAIFEDFCRHLLGVRGLHSTAPGASRRTEEPTETARHDTSAAAVLQSTTQEQLHPEASDLLHLGDDPRFSAAPPLMRVALANARIGQGGYRQRMMAVWGGRCALTGCPVDAVLIASHAKPWSLCQSDGECLDEYNGLLLSANLDRLFDQGLISFDDQGRVLSNAGPEVAKLVNAERLRFVDARHHPYFRWHRQHFNYPIQP